MPWICTPDFSDAGNDQGWTCRVWASAEVFGEPVPLTVSRWRLDVGARAHGIPLGGTEAFAYVIAGSGTAQAPPPDTGAERFGLDTESVLWLAEITDYEEYQHHGPDPAANMAAMTLAGVAGKATVPLLQVCGGNDPGSPPEHAERIAAEYAGPVTTVVYPDGVHILNNLWYQARPLVADWLAETL